MSSSSGIGGQRCHPSSCQENVERIHVKLFKPGVSMRGDVQGDLVQEGIFATMKLLQVQTVPAEMSMNPDMTGSRNDLK